MLARSASDCGGHFFTVDLVLLRVAADLDADFGVLVDLV